MSLFSARVIKKCEKMRRTKVRKIIMIWVSHLLFSFSQKSRELGNVNLRTYLDDIARQNCSLVFLVAGHVRFRRKYNTIVA